MEPQEFTIAERRRAGEMPAAARTERREASASWAAVAAPGALLTCSVLAITLGAAPWLTRFAQVAPAVRMAALALLLMHMATAVLVSQPGRQWAALLALAVLVLDALGAGILLGADLQPRSPVLVMAFVVLLMNMMVGGWLAVLDGVIAVGFGTSGAMLGGVTGLLTRSPTVWLPRTVLDVELLFAGVPAVGLSAPPLPTTLSVEPQFAGVPAVTSTSELFMPALAAALFAVCVGTGVTLLRARKAREAVAVAIVSGHGSVRHS
ncbi:MAG: hypothetical protein ACHQ9S_16960 [Candidatus Binatia bacterium]